MKRKRFSEEQIIEILRLHQAGAKPADLCRQHGISEATLYNWRSRYGGNARLGGQAAAVSGGRESPAEEVVGRSDARQRGLEGYRRGNVLRPAVRRRTCGLIGMDVSRYRYRSRRADDSALRERLGALAGLRRWFGYRRLGWMLERDGATVNLKKVYRLYRGGGGRAGGEASS